MGTNYYARKDACEHCGRGDEDIHICKSLVMFRGYGPGDPLGEIKSWADWRAVLEQGELRIFDEYGQEHSVAAFIADVEATAPEARRRQYDWMVAHSDPSNDWL